MNALAAAMATLQNEQDRRNARIARAADQVRQWKADDALAGKAWETGK